MEFTTNQPHHTICALCEEVRAISDMEYDEKIKVWVCKEHSKRQTTTVDQALNAPKETEGRKQYLGDGVYIEFDGFGVILTSEDGLNVDDRIYIELRTYRALRDYADKYIG